MRAAGRRETLQEQWAQHLCAYCCCNAERGAALPPVAAALPWWEGFFCCAHYLDGGVFVALLVEGKRIQN